MRKAFLFIAAMLMLGIGQAWGENKTCTFPNSGTPSSPVTVNDVSWAYSTTVKAGSPSVAFGNAYSKPCIKFGSGASNSFASVTLSTDYFSNNNYKVTKVSVLALGSAKKNVTFSIGTNSVTTEVAANSWTTITLDKLNISFGTLSLDFALDAAGFFINSITITCEEIPACSSKVAVTKGTESHGTFEIGGLDAEGKVCADGDGGEIVVTPTADAHYHVASISPTATDNEDGTYTISGIKAATTVSVNFEEDAKANVSWSVNGTLVSGGSAIAYVGEKVAELPNAPLSSACDGVKAFVGWSDAPVTDGNKPSVLFSKVEDAPEITSSADVTYYAVFATPGKGIKEYTFTINTSDFSTASYAANDGNHSVTATAGDGITMNVGYKSSNVMQSSSKMQFKATPGYIYNTTDLGTIKSVTNKDASNLATYYGTEEHPTSGTTVGNGFFTVQANGGTGKASSITVVFETLGTIYSNYATTCETSTPIIVVEPNKAVGYAASTGEEIAYEIKNAVDGVSLSASVNPEASWLTNIAVNAVSGKITFDVTANTSHKEVRTATITLTYEGAADAEVVVTQACEPLATMDAIFAAAATPDNYSITFNNWVISAVSGSNAYLTDGTKGLIIYNKSHGFKVGDVLSGTVMCSLTLFKGASEITTLTSTTEGLNVVAGGTVTAIEKSIADLSGVNTGALVTIKGIVTEEDKAAGQTSVVFADAAENEISVYKTLMTLPAFTGGIGYSITGIYIQYDATKELAPRSAADIEEVPVAKYAISVASPIENGSVSVDPDDEAAEGQKVTVTFEPNDGYKLASYSITDGIRLDAKNQFAMPAKPVEISAIFAVKEQYNITWMAKGEEFAVTQILEGDALEIPAAKPEGVGKYSFSGWTASASVETDVEPEYVSASTVIISDTTLYAVFGVAQESVDAYMLVESDRADWSGKYLIAANDSTFANGAIGGKDDEGSIGRAQTHVDPKDNLSADKKTIAKAWGDLYYVTLDTIAKGGYVLKTQDGKYNYQSSNANGLTASDKKATAAQYPISVVFNAADDVDLALGGNATGAIFHYNKNSGSEMFRFYKDGGQNAVYLYRYENYTIYSDYTLEPKAEPTALQNIMLNKGVKKAIMNGHLMIMREGRMYNAFGGRMR